MQNRPYKKFCSDVRKALFCFAAALVSITLVSTNAAARIVDGIAIVVNSDVVLVSEINDMLMPLMKEYRAKYAGAELKKKMAELRKTIIDQTIETRLILQMARKRGITASEKNVNARIETVKERFATEDEFLEALAAKGITYKEYRDQVAEQVLTQDTIRLAVGSGIRVSDNEIREYYESHLDEFITEPKVRLAQIFIEIPSGSTGEEIDELRQKGEQLRILIDDGIDFAELARKYSEGPYREKDGVIGEVGRKEILPELEENAFALKTGEVSPLIQTNYGFHIVKALRAIPAKEISLEEARPVIEERIREKERTEKFKEWIKKLREDAFIDVKI